MFSFRPSVRGSRLGSQLVLAMLLFVVPTAVLPALYHEVASHPLARPDCAICLTGTSTATAPEPIVAGRPLVPIGIVVAPSVIEPDTVAAGPVGGRSPPALG